MHPSTHPHNMSTYVSICRHILPHILISACQCIEAHADLGWSVFDFDQKMETASGNLRYSSSSSLFRNNVYTLTNLLSIVRKAKKKRKKDDDEVAPEKVLPRTHNHPHPHTQTTQGAQTCSTQVTHRSPTRHTPHTHRPQATHKPHTGHTQATYIHRSQTGPFIDIFTYHLIYVDITYILSTFPYLST